MKKVYQFKITLQNIEPLIWRRIQVNSDISLENLHQVILISMGWQGGHLHEFKLGRKRYGRPDSDFDMSDDLTDEANVKLHEVLQKPKTKMEYLYDFGDGWEHLIVLEKILDVEKKLDQSLCIDGKRACPPEDCGGTYGYQHLLDILNDKNDPEYEDTIDWLGESFDSEKFDIDEINESLKDPFILDELFM